jgi:hypothetical protein
LILLTFLGASTPGNPLRPPRFVPGGDTASRLRSYQPARRRRPSVPGWRASSRPWSGCWTTRTSMRFSISPSLASSRQHRRRRAPRSRGSRRAVRARDLRNARLRRVSRAGVLDSPGMSFARPAAALLPRHGSHLGILDTGRPASHRPGRRLPPRFDDRASAILTGLWAWRG